MASKAEVMAVTVAVGALNSNVLTTPSALAASSEVLKKAMTEDEDESEAPVLLTRQTISVGLVESTSHQFLPTLTGLSSLLLEKFLPAMVTLVPPR